MPRIGDPYDDHYDREGMAITARGFLRVFLWLVIIGGFIGFLGWVTNL